MRSVVLSVLLFVGISLNAANIAFETLVDFWKVIPSTPQIQLNAGSIANLIPYEIKFSDSRFAAQQGYVDESGRYVLVGAQVFVGSRLIDLIKSQGTLLPQTIDNLQAYSVPTNLVAGVPIVWVDSQNLYVISGSLYSEDYGVFFNQTFLTANYYIPVEYGNYVYNLSSSIASFAQGNPKAPRTIYVFGDPNSVHCNQLYSLAKPFVDSGQLCINWAMINAGTEITSPGVAWAIYDAKAPKPYSHSPSGAFQYNEDNFDATHGFGGLSPISKPSVAAVRILNQNEQFCMTQLTIASPVILYKNVLGQGTIQGGIPLNFTDLYYNVFNDQ